MARILNRKRKEQLLIRSMIRLVRQYRRDPVPLWATPYPFWVCRVVRFLGDERRGILTDCIIQRDFPAGYEHLAAQLESTPDSH